MLSIRFLRIGKKHQPSYKIVVVDKKRSSKSGKFTEQLGFYNPITKEKAVNKDRIEYWLSQGAQPSDTVYNLLVKEGIVKGEKIAVHSKKPSKKKETKQESPKEEVAKKEVKETKESPEPEVPAEEKKEKEVEKKEETVGETKKEEKSVGKEEKAEKTEEKEPKKEEETKEEKLTENKDKKVDKEK